MNKTFILCFVSFTAFLVTIKCERQEKNNDSRRNILRTFAIYSLKTLTDLAKNYELGRKLKDEIGKQEMKRINEEIRKEEMKRRKIFQQYLGSRQKSRTFWSDFHFDRYF